MHATKVLPNVVVNQTIDAHLDRVHFDHLEIEGDLDIKSGMVNDINIVSLNASAIRLDADQLVEGSMVFTKVSSIILENAIKDVLPKFFISYRVSSLKKFFKLELSTESTLKISCLRTVT